MPEINSAKIQVLSINTSDSIGGAARAAYRIHCGTCKYGVNSKMLVKQKRTDDPSVVALTVFLPKTNIWKFWNWCATKIKNKYFHFVWNHYPDREKTFMSDLRSTHLFGAFQKISYDVLHLHWINQRFIPLRSLLSVRKPIVWTLHDSWAFCGICHVPGSCNKYSAECGECPMLHSDSRFDLSRQVLLKKKKIYSKLDLHIVCPSNWLAECAKSSSLFQGKDIRVIPNCLDTDLFCPGNRNAACKSLGLMPGNRYVLFGAIDAFGDKNKGFDLLLSAMDLLVRQNGNEDIELLVFGNREPRIFMNHDYKVTCFGQVSDNDVLLSLYRASDVVAVPSYSEVFGQVAAEAMACGTPVTAFRCTGIQEVVADKSTGYLADAYDIEDFADGLSWCLKNREAQNLSKKARQLACDSFSVDAVSRLYSCLYKEIVRT